MVIASHRDKANRLWQLKVHSKGTKYEWYSIVSPLGHPDPENGAVNAVYVAGQAKYVMMKWKQLKNR